MWIMSEFDCGGIFVFLIIVALEVNNTVQYIHRLPWLILLRLGEIVVFASSDREILDPSSVCT